MVRAINRGFDILQLLSRRGPMGVTDLARALDLPKSTVHDLLSTLQHEGAVLRDSERQVFVLGWRLFELGQRAQEGMEIRRLARNYISNLSRDLDETVHLTVLDGGEVLYVDCVESTKRLRTYPVIGVRAPLYCTAVGKAIMAHMTEEQVERIIDQYGLARFTDNTITDRGRLFQDLAAIRRRGYSVDDVEHEAGVRCLGAPIRDHAGTVFASISVSGPTMRITRERVEELGRQVMTTADEISAHLGFRGGRIPKNAGGVSMIDDDNAEVMRVR
jgi:IclR family transcriptional regulator, KDG regulon repressor